MGKRELLLIAAFVIAGAIVYQVTAPAPAAGERSFSPGQMFEDLRRHIRGNQASADVTTTRTYPVEAGVEELFLGERPPEITIVGESRKDISAELRVHSNGFDDAEAQALAKETHLIVERNGVRMVAKMFYPEAGRQSATLMLRVPARLQIKVNPTSAPTKISGVWSVELTNSRGDTVVNQIAGRVSGTYRGGELRIADAGSVKLSTNGTELRLDRVRGEASVTMRGGELRGNDIVGPLELEGDGADIELDKLDKATGVMRIKATGGSVAVKGLRTEARMDVRGAEMDIVMEHAAPLAIYAEGGESIDVTPPPDGYELDAVASNGSITLPADTLEVTANGEERRATGAINGGGPTITLRSAHGSITVRPR
jgi:hypothetical protein